MEQESSNAIPGNVVAKGCLGTESTLTECNVREKDYIIMVISTDFFFFIIYIVCIYFQCESFAIYRRILLSNMITSVNIKKMWQSIVTYVA